MSSHLIKVGKVQTINAETGEVISEKANAATLLPPSPDVCQICATDHPFDEPHNQESLYYQYRFRATHGRWPTWTDAMAHCTKDIQTVYRIDIIKLLKERGMDIPEDLLISKQTGR